mmetsp:Transcript_70055/g.116779  ORF Transcript_70055/g.116779 Transcript_70055/m.116779 type:complete len:220 (-) Transcript_70055:776-1435(-)
MHLQFLLNNDLCSCIDNCEYLLGYLQLRHIIFQHRFRQRKLCRCKHWQFLPVHIHEHNHDQFKCNIHGGSRKHMSVQWRAVVCQLFVHDDRNHSGDLDMDSVKLDYHHGFQQHGFRHIVISVVRNIHCLFEHNDCDKHSYYFWSNLGCHIVYDDSPKYHVHILIHTNQCHVRKHDDLPGLGDVQLFYHDDFRLINHYELQQQVQVQGQVQVPRTVRLQL